MMNLSELIKKYSWEEIFLSRKFEYYDDYFKNERGYKKVFEELKELKPIKSVGLIELSNEYDELEKKYYIRVNGKYYDNDLTKNEFGFIDKYFALDFNEWEVIVGMEIDYNTSRKYSEIEIIVHCLWEITYYGFENENGPNVWEEILRKDIMQTRNKILKYAAFICHASEDKNIVWELIPD